MGRPLFTSGIVLTKKYLELAKKQRETLNELRNTQAQLESLLEDYENLLTTEYNENFKPRVTTKKEEVKTDEEDLFAK